MAFLRSLLVTLAVTLLPPVRGLAQNGSTFTPCDSPIYCQGELLREIQLAQPFSDSKTFVDLPTTRPLDEVLAAFRNLTRPLSNNTELNSFLSTYFGQAGSELAEVPEGELTTNPTFLDKIDDSVIKQFVGQVIDIWPDLTRSYVGAGNCSGCVSSFIPVNRTFVVAGGRFREPYYWDSYWIIEGLIRTGGSFTEISRNIIENFLDFVEKFGFVPNGARVYYLNRSQPPLLTQMVKIYVDYTNDTSILERALPLLIKEHNFWTTNRTVEITSGGSSYSLARYGVQNTEPRPESYREDYATATNKSYYAASGIIYPESMPLDDLDKATLYANLASGAESGWDYSSRWISTPSDAVDDVYFPLRSLNTQGIVGVDLNSILYANEITIAAYLSDSGNKIGAAWFEELARNRSAGMYDLMWNEQYHSYFDYNLTSQSQYLFVPADVDGSSVEEEKDVPEGYQLFLHPAQFYPFWLGAAPSHLKDNPLAVQSAFRRVSDLLFEKVGGIAATNLQTGQQWDQPNVWPPLMHILISALRSTPATFGEDDPAYIQTQELALELAQRYLDSTFCTWRATGGSTDEAPRLDGLNPDEVGIMFEKYADNSTNVAGSGGEYEVVEGFGWTNGVLIWLADTFTNELQRPDCGNLTAVNLDVLKRHASFGQRAVELPPRDAQWIRKFAEDTAWGQQ
ncbi:glycoside hydrolase family 37 protein [Xylariomycetidae sp. FL2044]|nr:glycoside hydrolase family 37 protein [Xylariomycetidae sp. FL2044]